MPNRYSQHEESKEERTEELERGHGYAWLRGKHSRALWRTAQPIISWPLRFLAMPRQHGTTGKLAAWVVSYHRQLLLLLLGITVTLAPGLRNRRMRPLLEGEIPATDSRVVEDKKLKQVFPDRDFYLLIVECPDGVFEINCLRGIRGLTRELKKLRGRSSPVISILSIDYIRASGDTVSVSPLVGDELPSSTETIQALRHTVLNDPLLFGRLVSRDERATLIYFSLDMELTQSEVHDALDNVVSRARRRKLRVYAAGDRYIEEEIDRGIAKDLLILLPLSLLCLAVLADLSLGSWIYIGMIGSVIILSIVWCYGLMGWLHVPSSVLTASIPVTLVAVVSSASFHLACRMRSEYQRGFTVAQAVRRTLTAVAYPVAMAGLTSALGFGSLIVFDISSIREFGIFSSVGIMAGMVISLTLIPALAISCPGNFVAVSPGKWACRFDRAIAALLRQLERLAPRHQYIAVGLVTALLVTAVVGVSRLRVGSNAPQFFPPGHPVREGYSSLEKHFGGHGFATVLFDSGKAEGIHDPKFLRAAWKFQENAQSEAGVVFGSSLVDTVIARMNRVFHQGRAEMEKIPDRRRLIAQYLLLYSFDAPDSLAVMTDPRHRYLPMDFLLDTEDTLFVDNLYSRWKKLGHQVGADRGHTLVMGGDAFLYSAQNHYIVQGKIRNIATSLLLAFVVCSLAFRSTVAGLLALLPVGLATLAVFGLMGFLGIPLDLASCVITSVVVGVGVDFTIHFLARVRELTGSHTLSLEGAVHDAILSAGRPILYDCLSNCCFIVFLASSFTPLRNFGWLMTLSMLLAALSTVVLVPLCLLHLRPALATHNAQKDLEERISRRSKT